MNKQFPNWFTKHINDVAQVRDNTYSDLAHKERKMDNGKNCYGIDEDEYSRTARLVKAALSYKEPGPITENLDASDSPSGLKISRMMLHRMYPGLYPNSERQADMAVFTVKEQIELNQHLTDRLIVLVSEQPEWVLKTTRTFWWAVSSCRAGYHKTRVAIPFYWAKANERVSQLWDRLTKKTKQQPPSDESPPAVQEQDDLGL